MRRALLTCGLAVLFASLGLLVAVDVEAHPGTYPYRTEKCPLDAVIVLDNSGSMGGGPGSAMETAKDGAKDFVDSLGPDDKSSLVIFNTRAEMRQELTFTHSDTRTAIDGVFSTGSTNVPDGVRTGHTEMLSSRARTFARAVMIVVGDGDGGGDPHPPADRAKADGIEVFAIRVGAGASSTDYQNMASRPTSTYYKDAATVAEIRLRFQEIIDEIPKVCIDFDVTSPTCHDEGPVVADITDLRVRAPNVLASLEVDWGDGSRVLRYTGTSPPMTHTHTYRAPGAYTVTMTGQDTGGNVDSTSRDLYLSGCPTPDFGCAPLTHPDWRTVVFNDRSIDPDDNILTYAWDFGDGDVGAGTGPRHVYAAEGSYDVTLTIEDADANIASITKTCFADDNRPPEATAPDEVVVHEGDVVRFDVSGLDPDGDAVFWTWSRAGLPSTATWSPSTMAFEWATHSGSAGIYPGVTFSIADPYFAPVAATTTIRVLPVEEAPPPENADADGDGIPDGSDPCQFCDEHLGSGTPSEGRATNTTDGTSVSGTSQVDTDGDGVLDGGDNCILTPNPAQADGDADGLGDACDPDLDGDHVPNVDGHGRLLDNCPYTYNPLQLDADGDGVGDDCHGDIDADGVADGSDNCRWIPNALQEDTDGDGTGDACEDGATPFGDGPRRDDRPASPDEAATVDTASDGLAGAAWAVGAGALVLVALALVLLRRRR